MAGASDVSGAARSEITRMWSSMSRGANAASGSFDVLFNSLEGVLTGLNAIENSYRMLAKTAKTLIDVTHKGVEQFRKLRSELAVGALFIRAYNGMVRDAAAGTEQWILSTGRIPKGVGQAFGVAQQQAKSYNRIMAHSARLSVRYGKSADETRQIVDQLTKSYLRLDIATRSGREETKRITEEVLALSTIMQTDAQPIGEAYSRMMWQFGQSTEEASSSMRQMGIWLQYVNREGNTLWPDDYSKMLLDAVSSSNRLTVSTGIMSANIAMAADHASKANMTYNQTLELAQAFTKMMSEPPAYIEVPAGRDMLTQYLGASPEQFEYLIKDMPIRAQEQVRDIVQDTKSGREDEYVAAKRLMEVTGGLETGSKHIFEYWQRVSEQTGMTAKLSQDFSISMQTASELREMIRSGDYEAYLGMMEKIETQNMSMFQKLQHGSAAASRNIAGSFWAFFESIPVVGAALRKIHEEVASFWANSRVQAKLGMTLVAAKIALIVTSFYQAGKFIQSIYLWLRKWGRWGKWLGRSILRDLKMLPRQIAYYMKWMTGGKAAAGTFAAQAGVSLGAGGAAKFATDRPLQYAGKAARGAVSKTEAELLEKMGPVGKYLTKGAGKAAAKAGWRRGLIGIEKRLMTKGRTGFIIGIMAFFGTQLLFALWDGVTKLFKGGEGKGALDKEFDKAAAEVTQKTKSKQEKVKKETSNWFLKKVKWLAGFWLESVLFSGAIGGAVGAVKGGMAGGPGGRMMGALQGAGRGGLGGLKSGATLKWERNLLGKMGRGVAGMAQPVTRGLGITKMAAGPGVEVGRIEAALTKWRMFSKSGKIFGRFFSKLGSFFGSLSKAAPQVAKWLPKLAKISKFGSRAIPIIGEVLLVYDAIDESLKSGFGDIAWSYLTFTGKFSKSQLETRKKVEAEGGALAYVAQRDRKRLTAFVEGYIQLFNQLDKMVGAQNEFHSQMSRDLEAEGRTAILATEFEMRGATSMFATIAKWLPISVVGRQFKKDKGFFERVLDDIDREKDAERNKLAKQMEHLNNELARSQTEDTEHLIHSQRQIRGALRRVGAEGNATLEITNMYSGMSSYDVAASGQ
jgi:hypothetical protein